MVTPTHTHTHACAHGQTFKTAFKSWRLDHSEVVEQQNKLNVAFTRPSTDARCRGHPPHSYVRLCLKAQDCPAPRESRLSHRHLKPSQDAKTPDFHVAALSSWNFSHRHVAIAFSANHL